MAQEEEATLMMAIASFPSDAPSPVPPSTPHSTSTSAALPALHLIERKVYATLDFDVDPDLRRWILDTDASNHMSGSKAAFANLDTGVIDSVRFDDTPSGSAMAPSRRS